jgi:hypothetical protein
MRLWRRIGRAGRIGVLLGAGAAGTAAAIAAATVPDPSGVIHACYEVQAAGAPVTTSANLRIIDAGAGQTCTTTTTPGSPAPAEAPLDWNKRGLTGRTGLTGVAGPPGSRGPAGTLTVTSPPPGHAIGEVEFGKGLDLSVAAITFPTGTSFRMGLPGRANGGTLTLTATAGSQIPVRVDGSHYPGAVLVVSLAGEAGHPYLVFNFKLVAVKTIQWTSGGDESPKETITFEYGGLVVHYTQQDPIRRPHK